MKLKNADLKRFEILGRTSPNEELRAAVRRLRQQRFGYFAVMAGVAVAVGGSASETRAETLNRNSVPSRVSERASRLVEQLNKSCTKPELLRRQSNYMLPHQKKTKAGPDLSAVMAGLDTCPGQPIPGGTYTVASPYTDSGTTVGANDTVAFVQAGCSDYQQVAGMDHIYSFTLTARGSTPQIRVTTTSGTYDPAIYILNGTTGAMCPAGVDNDVTNCLIGADANLAGGPETLSAARMNTLPLNVPLYLFVDSYYGDSRGMGPYTVTIQDVTIGGGPQLPEHDSPLDMNGDSKTDFVMVRNTGGGASGQATWYTLLGGGGPPRAPQDWGIASDYFVPADIDGDGKDDLVVWRPGTQGRFFMIQSQTNTIRIEDLGQTGDDPSVIGDYNGDNKDDLAVYRSGTAPGGQSFWFWRSVGDTYFQTVTWGQTGDFPAPGDYDGDNKNDFVVQRTDENGVNGRFYKRMATGAQSYEIFGLALDTIVPGDYDGDDKTDLAVVRPNQAGFLVWEFEPSGTPGSTVVSDVWGVAATDFLTPGDYDGDGKFEYAVWRPGNPGEFFMMTVGTRLIHTRQWGQTGDYPVANSFVH
jgi:hypothetical protein